MGVPPLVLHDNTLPYGETSARPFGIIAEGNKHSPHSWTQVNCDFNTFPKKKESLKGKWFCSVETVMQAVGQTFASINRN
jgi:hypothetical protein